MESSRQFGKIGHSWGRRQWLRLVAWMEDHPWPSLGVMVLGVGFVVFYGVRLGGISHFKTSFARWRVENFGGEIAVDRSIRVFDVLLSFEPVPYDRLDVVSAGAMPVGLSSLRQELNEVVKNDRGLVRYVALDPRLADPDRPDRAAFEELARRYGLEPWELREGIDLTMSAVLHVARDLGPGFEVRVVQELDAGGEIVGLLTAGRGAHAYRSGDPSARLDILLTGSGSAGNGGLAQPALVVRNRPDHPLVRERQEQFERLWNKAVPLDVELRKEVLEDLNG